MKFFNLLTILLVSTNIFGQNATDYYIPDSPKNKAVLKTPETGSSRTDTKRTITYANYNGYMGYKTVYDITDTNIYEGDVTRIVKYTVAIQNNEVLLLNSTTTSMQESNKKRTFDKSTVLLKVPSAGKVEEWTSTDPTGAAVKLTAQLVMIDFLGVSKRAIKLETRIDGNEAMAMVSYFVDGVGLYKEDIEMMGLTQGYSLLDRLVIDPNLK